MGTVHYLRDYQEAQKSKKLLNELLSLTAQHHEITDQRDGVYWFIDDLFTHCQNHQASCNDPLIHHLIFTNLAELYSSCNLDFQAHENFTLSELLAALSKVDEFLLKQEKLLSHLRLKYIEARQAEAKDLFPMATSGKESCL